MRKTIVLTLKIPPLFLLISRNIILVMLNYPKLWIILLDLKINDLSLDVFPDFGLNNSLKIITLLGLIKIDYAKFFNK